MSTKKAYLQQPGKVIKMRKKNPISFTNKQAMYRLTMFFLY